MHRDDVRMIQRREGLRFFFKSHCKLRIIRALRREQLQCDEPVQRFLPRLVNHAHPAASKALQDFQLREVGREFRGRRAPSGRSRFIRVLRRHHRLGQEALGTKPLRGGGRQGRPAPRAGVQGWRWFAHVRVLTRWRGLVTKILSQPPRASNNARISASTAPGSSRVPATSAFSNSRNRRFNRCRASRCCW